ncbi:60S ribosomal protein L33B [Gurleya vavrai]
MNITEIKQEELISRITIPSVFISHKRSQRRLYPKYALLRIEPVKTRDAALKYVGNCVEFVRNGKRNLGRVTRAHGNSGVIMARFKTNLAPQDVGKTVNVKLYKINDDEI